MEKEQITIIAEQLAGLKQHQWSKVKTIVDAQFSSKAAKVVLDDSTELKRNLEVEFNFRRFGER